MRKRLFVILATCLGIAVIPAKADAQVEIIGELVKQVIMAIDLNVQKIQTRTILLQDAQQQVQNIMQASQLGDIIDWIQQQKDLFAEYYQELREVKAIVATYVKVNDIIDKQELIVTDYRLADNALRTDPHFSPQEINYISRVYEGILVQSKDNIDQLITVITSFITQMDDADRLHDIDDLGARIDDNYNTLQRFTQENILLSMQRAKGQQDIDFIRSLYGIQ
jgi:hypothetical protein